jgi:hypothetical protein
LRGFPFDPRPSRAQVITNPPCSERATKAKPGKALRKFDQVIAVAFDETWMAEAVVADARSVVLSKPRITTFPKRYDPLFADENYELRWTGVGYAVFRKKDKHQMTAPVATTALAERDLKRLYPQDGIT